MADLNNTDYLKYDAISMQQLLRRKLTEKGYYTDQMYPGSDIKMVMDIFSWTFSCLTYMLNNNAAESMFDSAAVYEHLNKLVKILSYKPRGYITSNCKFLITVNEKNDGSLYSGVLKIPRFTSLVVGGSDDYGYPIKYTFLEDYEINVKEGKIVNLSSNEYPILYNGFISKYNEEFEITGIANEQFLIDLSVDDQSTYNSSILSSPNLIVDDKIYVFLQHINQNTGAVEYQELERVEDLYFEGSPSKYNYEVRLNEYKKYVITFGDGVHGKILPEGDSLIILYLQSNGQAGVLDSGFVNNNNSVELIVNNMSSDQMINVVFGGVNLFKTNYSDLFILNDSFVSTTELISLTNIDESSKPQNFESVEDIRINAPKSFATGHRLLSTDDFTAYVENNFKSEISSALTMDNNEYTLTFLKWLYLYDCLNVSIVKNNYKFSDACDFNNIYIWVKGRTKNKLSNNQLQQIVNACNRKKCATANIVPCNGVTCLFMPFVDSNTNPFDYNEIYNLNWDEKLKQLKIKIIKQQGVYVTDGNIKYQVANIISEYFKEENTKLGQLIDLNYLYKKIITVPGVKAIRTVNEFLGSECDGLSFACFSSTCIDGKDFNIFTDSKQLLSFQYPQLFHTDISNCIEINSVDD